MKPKISPEQVEKLRKYSGLSKPECRELLGLAEGDYPLARFMADSTKAAYASVEAARTRPKKRATDPVFGRITWDFQWEGRGAAKTLGKKVRVSVESADAAPPDERQREAYRQFLRAEKKVAPAVRAAHLRYYRKFRRMLSRDGDEQLLSQIAPPLRSADDVVAMLEQPTVHVPRQPRRGWDVQLQWECDWDPEHGHQVTIRSGAIRSVGPQGG
jgi:hypothetical protein